MTCPRPTPADRGTYIGLDRGRHEMDRDLEQPGATQAVKVPAESALKACAAVGGAGRANHAGPGESPGAITLPPGWRLSADGDRLSPREA